MRALAAFLLLLLAFSGAAEARMHYGANHAGPGHRLRGQPLVFGMVGLDYNFQSGSYSQPVCTTAATCLTTTRASTGYAEDSAGNYTSFAANQPRITDKGLLIEEARTNGIRNNSMQGVVAGTPGTLPTSWTNSGLGSLTRTVVGTGTEGGIDYIDVRFFGTTNNTFFAIVPDFTVAALTGQTWTQSNFIKLVGGTLANVTLSNIIQEYTAGLAYIKNTAQGNFIPTSASLGSQRQVLTATLSGGATTGIVTAAIGFIYTVGVPLDFTIRIGWPQLEQAVFASSPIRTTTAAVTRAADVVTVTTPPAFGSAYTMYMQGAPPPQVAAGGIVALQLDNGTAAERVLLRRNTSGVPFFTTTKASVDVSSGNLGNWVTDTRGKFALGVAAGAEAGSFDGGAVVTTASALPVSPTRVLLGPPPHWNRWIERIAIWPSTKLTDAELQAVTAP